MKSVQIRSFFWSVLSCIRTEYGDLLRKYRKIRTRKNSVFEHFLRNDITLSNLADYGTELWFCAMCFECCSRTLDLLLSQQATEGIYLVSNWLDPVLVPKIHVQLLSIHTGGTATTPFLLHIHKSSSKMTN